MRVQAFYNMFIGDPLMLVWLRHNGLSTKKTNGVWARISGNQFDFDPAVSPLTIDMITKVSRRIPARV